MGEKLAEVIELYPYRDLENNELMASIDNEMEIIYRAEQRLEQKITEAQRRGIIRPPEQGA